MDTLNAVRVGSVTMVGGRGEFPFEHGNCFSLICEDGTWYSIVNFVYENLDYLLEHGLTWPVRIRPLSKNAAVIHDPRISERVYRKTYCTVCCPQSLLPEPQRMAIERELDRGDRKETEVETKDGRKLVIISYGPAAAREPLLGDPPPRPPVDLSGWKLETAVDMESAFGASATQDIVDAVTKEETDNV